MVDRCLKPWLLGFQPKMNQLQDLLSWLPGLCSSALWFAKGRDWWSFALKKGMMNHTWNAAFQPQDLNISTTIQVSFQMFFNTQNFHNIFHILQKPMARIGSGLAPGSVRPARLEAGTTLGCGVFFRWEHRGDNGAPGWRRWWWPLFVGFCWFVFWFLLVFVWQHLGVAGQSLRWLWDVINLPTNGDNIYHDSRKKRSGYLGAFASMITILSENGAILKATVSRQLKYSCRLVVRPGKAGYWWWKQDPRRIVAHHSF